MWIRPGQDDDLDGIVLRGAIEGGVEIVGQLQILRVALLRAVHDEPGNAWRRGFIENGRQGLCGHVFTS